MADRVLNWPGNPAGRADALPLRLAGALHGLIVENRAPALAAVYPPNDGHVSDDTLWDAVLVAFRDHAEFLLARLDQPPQTNECQRSSGLCPGFLTVAARFGLPLVLSELGASAGVNQVWDRFEYRFGDAQWGEDASPVKIAPDWSGPPPPIGPVEVLARAGCDRAPPDLSAEADRLRLESFVFADQPERMARLRAAMRLAQEAEIRVVERDALDWLRERLALRFPGAAHVVYHSIFWQYLDAAAQDRASGWMSRAGQDASETAPLAWLRFEGDGNAPGGALLLTLWPTGETQLIGRMDFHGRWVHWTGWR